jgi:hypothetical protein
VIGLVGLDHADTPPYVNAELALASVHAFTVYVSVWPPSSVGAANVTIAAAPARSGAALTAVGTVGVVPGVTPPAGSCAAFHTLVYAGRDTSQSPSLESATVSTTVIVFGDDVLSTDAT